MKRYVSLPAIRARVPLGQYLNAWMKAKANPERTYKHGLSTSSPSTGAAVLREFRDGMHDRINTKGGVESAYRPTLMGHHWQMQSYHSPVYFLLSVLAKHSRITPAIAAEYVLGQFDYEIEYETATGAVAEVMRKGLVAERDGVLALTHKGKRALRKRIVTLCKVH